LLERVFHLEENQTTVCRELLAGLTTFMTMAYVVVVNPQILSEGGMPVDGVLFATCISSAVATLIMGLWANCPTILVVRSLRFPVPLVRSRMAALVPPGRLPLPRRGGARHLGFCGSASSRAEALRICLRGTGRWLDHFSSKPVAQLSDRSTVKSTKSQPVRRRATNLLTTDTSRLQYLHSPEGLWSTIKEPPRKCCPTGEGFTYVWAG